MEIYIVYKFILMIVVSTIAAIYTYNIIQDDTELAYKALRKLGITDLNVLSVQKTHRLKNFVTLYIIAKTPANGLVNIILKRQKSFLGRTEPWELISLDTIY